MRVWPVILTVAACGAKPARPAQPLAAPSGSQPPAPACITPPDDVAEIDHVALDGTRVAYCVGSARDQCFSLDLATGKLAHLAAAPHVAPEPGARVTITARNLQICNGDACKSITPQVLPNASRLQATTNADGSYAVVLLGDAAAGRGHAEVWSVAEAKRTASFTYARGDFRCGEVAMLGETIYLSATTCNGPAARAALYTLKGRKIANVGGHEFGTYGNAHVHLAGTTWAFLDENGSQLVLQDVVTGKITKTIDTSGLWTADGAASKDAMGNPGEHAVARLADDKVAVIAGTPANGSIAVVDPGSGDVKIVRAALCK